MSTSRLVPARLILTAALVCLAGFAGAAELQVRTTDGQVIQGEYLGTVDSLVRIRTAYGTVSIPQKNVVTLLAVNSEKPAPPAPTDEATEAADPAKLSAPAAPAPTAEPVVEAVRFKAPRDVSLSSLLAARMPTIPVAALQNRSELLRAVRYFAEGDAVQRGKAVRTLQNFGLMAYPFIQGGYASPQELPAKIDLLQGIAQPHRPFTAELFSTTHELALAEMQRQRVSTGEVPPGYFSSRYQNTESYRPQRLRVAAQGIRRLESFAGVSGGPFNALFLLGVYRDRYSGTYDALLMDPHVDAARLAATASDYKNAASGWTPPDRVLLCELAFPLYFSDRDTADLKAIAHELLRHLLPERHPKWTAPESEWVEWWAGQREKILK